MAQNRDGNFFLSFSGKKIYPLDPRPEDICLGDISVALSQIIRFGGHSMKPCSVAVHSMLVMDLIGSSNNALMGAALLHDATEAYLGDMVSPFKKTDMMSPYVELEKKWQAVISDKYNIPISDWAHVVDNADSYALYIEHRECRPNIIEEIGTMNNGLTSRNRESFLRRLSSTSIVVAREFFAIARSLGIKD